MKFFFDINKSTSDRNEQKKSKVDRTKKVKKKT